MAFLRQSGRGQALRGAPAQGLGQGIGAILSGIGNMGGDGTEEAIRDLEAWAQTPEAAKMDPSAYAATAAAKIVSRGLRPGPVYEAMIRAKEMQWRGRKEQPDLEATASAIDRAGEGDAVGARRRYLLGGGAVDMAKAMFPDDAKVAEPKLPPGYRWDAAAGRAQRVPGIPSDEPDMEGLARASDMAAEGDTAAARRAWTIAGGKGSAEGLFPEEKIEKPTAPLGLDLPPGYFWNAETQRAERAPGVPVEEKEPKPPTGLKVPEGYYWDAEKRRLMKAEGAPDLPAAGGAGDKGFDRETKLRTEYVAQAKDFVTIRDSYGRVKASAKDPSAAGDLALIFNYMKILDPGSVVRESEFATAQNAAGVPDRIRNVYNRILSGERLAPEQRNDFVRRADDLFGSAKAHHGTRVKEYERLAKQNNLNPSNVIIDLGLVGDDTPAPKQGGDYRHLWGD